MTGIILFKQLIKAEATNAALTEAAQLDRSRLHEQAMRIGQFEAEHRALLDRISILQTTEANAQRGIVRLQVSHQFLSDSNASLLGFGHKFFVVDPTELGKIIPIFSLVRSCHSWVV